MNNQSRLSIAAGRAAAYLKKHVRFAVHNGPAMPTPEEATANTQAVHACADRMQKQQDLRAI